MEKLEEYRHNIEKIINYYADLKPSYGNVDMQAVTDHIHDRYQVMGVGWDKDERVHHCVIHMDIIDNKIWVQEDATDIGIANELVEMGVPKEDIVLAFHPPYKRPYTGFAVN